MSNQFEKLYNESKEANANLTHELGEAKNEIASKNSEIENLKAENANLQTATNDYKSELEKSNSNFEAFRAETFKNEETLFVENLIQEGKISATEKDEEVAILTTRRIENIQTKEGEANSYLSRRELLQNRADMHANLKTDLTGSFDGSGDDYKNGANTYESKEAAIDELAEKISAKEGISYEEAEPIARQQISGVKK
jgi:chromosome segregation ATPase